MNRISNLSSHSKGQSYSSVKSSQSKGSRPSISRPILDEDLARQHHAFLPTTILYTRPSGPAPHRPRRPSSLDSTTLAFMRDTTARHCLPTRDRGLSMMTSQSTQSSQTSNHVTDYLGLFNGHSPPAAPRLATAFAVRLSNELVLSESSERIATATPPNISPESHNLFCTVQLIKSRKETATNLDPSDEQYRPATSGDWRVEKRVSRGDNGNPGMLLRNESGEWHYVPDI